MVSLISSADSDNDLDQNSPRDDKLISELRTKLLQTPIIKGPTSSDLPRPTLKKQVKSGEFLLILLPQFCVILLYVIDKTFFFTQDETRAAAI